MSHGPWYQSARHVTGRQLVPRSEDERKAQQRQLEQELEQAEQARKNVEHHGAERLGYRGVVSVAHAYEAATPYWIVEVVKVGAAGGSWKGLASCAAQAIVARSQAATASAE
jgi:hypothetical protein